MKINNTNVKGIYSYDQNVQFESGDFIVYNGKIYIAQTSVLGVDPELGVINGYYKVYLSDDIASVDEILDGAAGNKLISVQGLVSLLESRISGISSQGIITNEIIGDVKSAELYLTNFFGTITEHGIYADVLDHLLISKTVGCAVYKVDKNATTIGTSTDDKFLVLHQYAYENSNKVVEKVQEIIASDLIAVRSGNVNGEISDWKILKSTDPLKLVNSIVSLYESKINELNNIRFSLTNNYGKLIVSGELFNSSESTIRSNNEGKGVFIFFKDISFTDENGNSVTVPEGNYSLNLTKSSSQALSNFISNGITYERRLYIDEDCKVYLQVRKNMLRPWPWGVIAQYSPAIISIEQSLEELLDNRSDFKVVDKTPLGSFYSIVYEPGVDLLVNFEISYKETLSGDTLKKRESLIFYREELEEIYNNPATTLYGNKYTKSMLVSFKKTMRYVVEISAITLTNSGQIKFDISNQLFGDNSTADDPTVSWILEGSTISSINYL